MISDNFTSILQNYQIQGFGEFIFLNGMRRGNLGGNGNKFYVSVDGNAHYFSYDENDPMWEADWARMSDSSTGDCLVALATSTKPNSLHIGPIPCNK